MTPPPVEDAGDVEGRGARPSERGGPRFNRGLVALATAGVVTVYAAGYVRTDSAAEQLEGSGAGRRADDAASATATPASPSSDGGSPDRGDGSQPGPTAPAPEAAVAPPAPTSPAGPAEPSADTAAPGATRFKDGLYSGWGQSLHGSIEATVEIRSGRILSAKISTCKTRWPCARIAYLVPQVAERQSQEVDVITGATHSSDAFYYALVEALSKAR